MVSEAGGNRWARYRIPINLARQNIRVGDELKIRLNGKSLDGQGYVAVVKNNSWNTILESHSFTADNQWETFNFTFEVPSGTRTIDIWLFADFGVGNGSAVYDNLRVRNLDGV